MQKEHETTTNFKESFNALIYTGVLLQYILLCVNIFNARRRTCRSCIYKNICCLNLLECQLCSLVLSTAEPTRRIEDEILERRGLHIRNNERIWPSSIYWKMLLLRLEFRQWGNQYRLKNHRTMSWNTLNKFLSSHDIFPDSSSKNDHFLHLPSSLFDFVGSFYISPVFSKCIL